MQYITGQANKIADVILRALQVMNGFLLINTDSFIIFKVGDTNRLLLPKCHFLTL